MLDESVELGFEITGQIIVLQRDPVLAGLVPIPPRNSTRTLTMRILCLRVDGDEQIRWQDKRG